MKDIEGDRLRSYEEAPWPDKHIIHENKNIVVYKDGYPVTEGHLLFVPKKNDVNHVSEAYKLAFYCGEQWIKEGKMDGFNIGQNIGKAAGQSIMWPHVHLIPRHEGDSDPKQHNGVRLSAPNGHHINEY